MGHHKIVQAHVTYKDDGTIDKCRVLVDINNSNGYDIRALESGRRPMGGYHWIKPTDELNEEMINNVVAAGYEVDSFPGYDPKKKK